MKKIGTYFLVLITSALVFLLGFDYNTAIKPHTYYQVYLDNELIGTIESKKELENYINSQADEIKNNIIEYKSEIDSINTYNNLSSRVSIENPTSDNIVKELLKNSKNYNLTEIEIDNLKKYKEKELNKLSSKEISEMNEYIENNNIYTYADEVFTPNGIKIKKIYTYQNDIVEVPEIYKKIIEKKSCTIAGYKFTIKSKTDGVADIVIYTLDTNTFNDAIEDLITIFVDESKYESYKNNSQSEISTTGSIIENVYIDEDITYKAINVPVDEKIYTSSKDLSAYLLLGGDFNQRTAIVQPGDTIESLSFNNQISVQEFLIFNSKYTSRDNLLAPGTEVVIATIDPKIKVVEEMYEVVDKSTPFATVEQYDANLTQGSTSISQEGENGLDRVSQNVKIVNGEITYVDPVAKEVIKSPVPKVVNIGTRYVPHVGSTTSWGWPTDGGYTLSSYYGYRPMTFGSNWHSGLDIAGTGYGSNIYAANNGVIITREYHYSYGWYIVIDHNNGYYTAYAHMSSFAGGFSVGSTVARGQVIGFVGTSGSATGPHLHYEVRTCPGFNCTTNPLDYY